jgi:hypothetical protein
MEIKKLQKLHFKNEKKVNLSNVQTKIAVLQEEILLQKMLMLIHNVLFAADANIMNGSEKFIYTKCFSSNQRGIVLDKLIAPLKNVPIEIQVEINAPPEASDILPLSIGLEESLLHRMMKPK